MLNDKKLPLNSSHNCVNCTGYNDFKCNYYPDESRDRVENNNCPLFYSREKLKVSYR
jgi:hypothetical protein